MNGTMLVESHHHNSHHRDRSTSRANYTFAQVCREMSAVSCIRIRESRGQPQRKMEDWSVSGSRRNSRWIFRGP